MKRKSTEREIMTAGIALVILVLSSNVLIPKIGAVVGAALAYAIFGSCSIGSTGVAAIAGGVSGSAAIAAAAFTGAGATSGNMRSTLLVIGVAALAVAIGIG
jgi:hypothetical protein